VARQRTLATLGTRVALVLVALSACSIGQASAQDQVLSEIGELVRKAESKEMANGFRARMTWPNGNSTEQFRNWLQSARVDTWKVNTFTNGNCQYDRVTRIHQENGGKCVTYTWHACDKDGVCGMGASTDCLNAKGAFVDRRDAK
jgi:hypothetical protein